MDSEKNGSQLISVITIFFNSQRHMEEAVESVLAQTYRNWELLLVDDGSTDRSTEIAMEYVKRFPERIRYLHHDNHQNRGMSATRNLGVANAKGEYIAFLDSDDVWLPYKLEEQIDILQSHPNTDMVFGAAKYWHSWSGNESDRKKDYTPSSEVASDRVYSYPDLLLLLYPLGTAPAPCPSDLLIRRTCVEMVGGFEERFTGIYQLYEDQAFLSKVYLSHNVFLSSRHWLNYRIHPESCQSVVIQSGNYQNVRSFYLNWLKEYLEARQQTEGAAWEALCHAQQNAATDNPFDQDTKESGEVLGEKPRRLTPLSIYWGVDRGRPIDRYYIENFLEAHSADIFGRTLEIEDDSYTSKYGGEKTTIRDVLHLFPGHPKATIFGDLTSADHIPSNTFDCIVLTQTLQLIYDTRAALKTLERILKPGGTLLATFPGITQQSQDVWRGYWCWSFTSTSARRLFEESFPSQNVEIQTWGNVLIASAFLYGYTTEEMTREELDYNDPNYEVLITVRARKAE